MTVGDPWSILTAGLAGAGASLAGVLLKDTLDSRREAASLKRSVGKEKQERLLLLYTEGLALLGRYEFLHQGELNELRIRSIELQARFRLLAPARTAQTFFEVGAAVLEKAFEVREWAYTPVDGQPILRTEAGKKLFEYAQPLIAKLGELMKVDLAECGASREALHGES